MIKIIPFKLVLSGEEGAQDTISAETMSVPVTPETSLVNLHGLVGSHQPWLDFLGEVVGDGYQCDVYIQKVRNTFPFRDLAPAHPPAEWRVSQHRVGDRTLWFVIDGEGSIQSHFDEQWRATWSAWMTAARIGAAEYPPQMFAHLRVVLDLPPGYRVAHSEGLDWFFSEGSEGNTADGHGFSTALEARIEAWKDYYQRGGVYPLPAPGSLPWVAREPSDEGEFVVHRLYEDRRDGTSGSRVIIHHRDPHVAQCLRENVLAFFRDLEGES